MADKGPSLQTQGKKLNTCFIAALFLLLPLILHKGYYDTTKTKAYAFFLIGGIYLLVLSFLSLKGLGKEKAISHKVLDKETFFLLLFVCIGVLSTLFGENSQGSFLSKGNRYQGIACFVLYALLFVGIRRFGYGSSYEIWLYIGLVVVALLGTLNQFTIDPLSFVTVLRPNQQGRYTSTLGNIGFYGSYMALLFPLVFFRLLHSKSIRQCFLYGLLSALALLGLLSAKTEGALLSLLAALCLTPLLLQQEHALRSYCLSLPVLWLCMGLYGLCVRACNAYPLSLLTQALLRPIPFTVILFLFAVMAVLGYKLEKERLFKLSKLYQRLFLFGVCGFVFLFISCNLFLAPYLPEGLAKYMIITPSWGTDRGLVWSRMLDFYKQQPLANKLFGGGFGCIARWDTLHPIFPDAITDAAHNEYLHYLITHGAVGLAAYLFFLFMSVKKGLKKHGHQRGVILSVLVYCVQALVGIAQPSTTPLFFALLAMLTANEEPSSLQIRSNAYIIAAGIGLVVLCLFIGYRCTQIAIRP